MRNILYALVLLTAILFTACDKTESLSYSAVDYRHFVEFKLKDTWYYNLDSTALLNFGADTVVRHYELKDSVTAAYLDGSNQQTYKVFRYIRPKGQTTGWNFLNIYQMTATASRLEVIDEKNFRFIKLVTPVSNGYSWDGNAYFTKNTNFSSNSDTAFYVGWNYVYANNYASLDFGNSHFDSTVTVQQADITNGYPVFDPAAYQEKIYANEIYAKHIGMIYQKRLHLTWQPANGSSSGGYTSDSYGVELWMNRE